MSDLNDYLVEILQYSPGTAAPTTVPVDVTGYVLLDGFGAINRAAERDLLSFKTGDVTIALRTADGYIEDLFALLEPSDRWQLRIYRRGEIQFGGVIMGQGSIVFDRTEQTCEITAYGLTRHLQDTSAEGARRLFGVNGSGLTLNGAVIAGATTLTFSPFVSTGSLLTGDVLHITDQQNKEDVTIKQVTSATTVTLEAGLVNGYASGSPVTVSTPYHRYKSIEDLVIELCGLADIPVAELLVSPSQFRRLAPVPVNLEGMDVTATPRHYPAQWNGKTYILMSSSTSPYVQTTPDAAWTQEVMSPVGYAPLDWSRYYTEAEAAVGEPSMILRASTTEVPAQYEAAVGQNWRAGTKELWRFGQIPNQITRSTSADGFTWTAFSNISAHPNGTVALNGAYSVEFDYNRNYCYVYKAITNDTTLFSHVYDITGVSWTTMAQADDASYKYVGMTYIPDKDYVLCHRVTNRRGPDSEICAFRGTTRLWKRTFPNCLMTQTAAGEPIYYPSSTARMVNGSLYLLLIQDGAVKLLRTDDEFQTYVMNTIQTATNKVPFCAARIDGKYRIYSYDGANPRGHMIAAPFYAGVVEYADFAGLSVAEALKELSVLVNAIFWVDDAGQAHFVSRDLLPAGDIPEIEDRIKTRADTAIWDQTVQYTEVSGGGVSVVSGDHDFAASGLSIQSDLIPNEAFAQALADSYDEFYSRRRQDSEVTVRDPDGHIYQPLDRVTIDGFRYMVYESDHSLTEDEVRLSLLEDV